MNLKPHYYRQRFKYMNVRPGYGERRRKKLEEKHPLLALIPGEIPSAEEIEAKQQKNNADYGCKLRQSQARNWIALRKWLRETTPEKRELFFKVWRCLPHEPHYGLDLAHRI